MIDGSGSAEVVKAPESRPRRKHAPRARRGAPRLVWGVVAAFALAFAALLVWFLTRS